MKVLKALFAMIFIGGGINHFVNPEFYLMIIPPYLPWHLALVYISGVFEILLGVGLLIPRFQTLSAWGLIALLVAVSPANIHMYLNSGQYPEMSKIALFVRLILQVGLVIWAYSYTKRKDTPAP